MKILNQIGLLSKKFSKGMLALFTLSLTITVCVFTFDSCKKNQFDNSKSGIAARNFNDVLNASKSKIGSIILQNNNSSQNNNSLRNNNSLQSRISRTEGTYYLDFPDGTNPEIITNFTSNMNIRSLTNVLENYHVSIDDTTNLNAEVTINVPEDSIRTALQPLVVAAKNYLMSKGATDQQITDMLQEKGAEEVALIPFVKELTSIELGQYTAHNISIPFISEANALPKFVTCGLAAIGADALYALTTAAPATWSWAIIKTAFADVAERFLGPIGVCVAVVTFGLCMLG